MGAFAAARGGCVVTSIVSRHRRDVSSTSLSRRGSGGVFRTGTGSARRRLPGVTATATTAASAPAGAEKINDGVADLPDKQDGISEEGGAKIGSLTKAILALDEDAAGDAEAMFDVIVEWATDVKGMELYEAQEEAIMELVEGNSVLLTTPTGSGKTLVATAALAAATARGDVGPLRGGTTKPDSGYRREKDKDVSVFSG